MKYFNSSLWEQINDIDSQIRDKANKEWDRNSNEYFTEYNSLKKYLSNEFIEIYENEIGFHDWKIEKIEILSTNTEIQICIRNSKKAVAIIYNNAKSFNIDIGAHNENDEWGYDEFSLTNNDYIKHEILMQSGAVICIIFEEIHIVCN